MSRATVNVEVANRQARLTLNRPERHNAFDETLIAELTTAYQRLGDDPGVRVIVLGGAGASFCAGADLEYMGRMAGYSRDQNISDSWALQRMFATIAECPKVTIARVHGAALGGGAGLVAVCDVAVASTDARIALSEVRLGLVPAVVGPYVVEKIGLGAARALTVTGRRIGADEALRVGLVQQVVSVDALDDAVASWAADAVSAGPQAVATAKRLLRDIAGLAPGEAAPLTVECIADLRAGPEGREGIRAFLEKRKPGFAD